MSGDKEKKLPTFLSSLFADRPRAAMSGSKDDSFVPPPSYPVFNAHLSADHPKSNSTSQLPEPHEPARGPGPSKLALQDIPRPHEDEFEDVGGDEDETHMSPQERTSLLSTIMKEMRESHVEKEEDEDEITELNVKLLRDNIKRFNQSLSISKTVIDLSFLQHYFLWDYLFFCLCR